MRPRFLHPRRHFLPAVLLFGLAAGCTDEKIVFREPVNPPPDASSGFLGYFSANTRQTTCGNCHTGMQAQWKTSAHADAFATLDLSGHAQASCYGCHTVSERGNALAVAAGWNVVKDPAYRDVQCESCHGPGYQHVQNPDDPDQRPYASMRAAVDANNGCGECHAGTHHPFVEEWTQSRHGRPNPEVLARGDANAASCVPCHTAQGALRAWGERTNYIEDAAPLSQHLGIVCAVCHDPHGSPNSAQLRFPIDVPSREENLCVKCHHKRAEPEIATVIRGPHSPEGPLLLGEGAGWFPPGFEPEVAKILGTHGSSRNPRLCVTCHVASFDVTDKATGEFVVTATGHRFLAIPCVDANGAPTASQDCALSQRTFASCTAAGCHGDQTAARSAYITAHDDIEDLVADVDALLALPAVAPDNVQNDGRFTVADGAWFNSQLAKLSGSAVHNPFLIKALLRATINALEATYGVTAPAVRLARNRQER